MMDPTNLLTRKVVEIAHRGEDFAPALDGFDPTGRIRKISASTSRSCQVLRGFFDDDLRADLRLRLGLVHLADGQDAIARRRVIETGEIGQELVNEGQVQGSDFRMASRAAAMSI
jgi:hypothetical protein